MLKIFPVLLLLSGCHKTEPNTAPVAAISDVPAIQKQAVARLSSLRPIVKHRETLKPEWSVAREGMGLSNKDELKTHENAFARVEFFSGKAQLDIQEKSFVVIWDREEDKRKVHVVALPDGSLKGIVKDAETELEVRTPGGWIKANGKKKKEVELSVQSNASKKVYHVTVNKGEAIVQTASREAVVKEGRSAKLVLDESIKEVGEFMEVLPLNSLLLKDKKFQLVSPVKKEFKTKDESLTFSGIWEGDFSVWANGQIINPESGSFTYTHKLELGLNVITFQVSDPDKKNVEYFIYKVTRVLP